MRDWDTPLFDAEGIRDVVILFDLDDREREPDVTSSLELLRLCFVDVFLRELDALLWIFLLGDELVDRLAVLLLVGVLDRLL